MRNVLTLVFLAALVVGLGVAMVNLLPRVHEFENPGIERPAASLEP